MNSLLILTLTTALTFAQDAPPLPSIVNEYVAEFRNDFDVRLPGRNNYRPLLANVVRLAFHYCVGESGCDGCVNMAVPDNAGLELSVDYLEDKADAWLEAGLSKADLYGLASMVAANMALGNNGWDSDLSNFEIGRTDCENLDLEEEFPNAHQEPFSFMADQFGFSDRDTVVIMGAHTLGRAQVGNSGFQNFWVNNPLTLGNEFFERIEDNPWDQIQVGDQFQWDQNGRLALNSDMFLVRDLAPNADGRETDCPNNFNGCNDADTLEIVEQFVDDEQQFQEEFKEVYTRMLRSAGGGFEQDLQLICDVFDCNAETQTEDEIAATPEPEVTTPVEEVEEEVDPEQPAEDSVEEEEEVQEDSASEESEEVEAEQSEEEEVQADPSSEDDSASEESDDEEVEQPEEENDDVVPPPPPPFRPRGKGRGRRGKGRGRLLL